MNAVPSSTSSVVVVLGSETVTLLFKLQKPNGRLGFSLSKEFTISDIKNEAPTEVKANLKVGDQILEMNGRHFESLTHLLEAIKALKEGNDLIFLIQRKRKKKSLMRRGAKRTNENQPQQGNGDIVRNGVSALWDKNEEPKKRLKIGPPCPISFSKLQEKSTQSDANSLHKEFVRIQQSFQELTNSLDEANKRQNEQNSCFQVQQANFTKDNRKLKTRNMYLQNQTDAEQTRNKILAERIKEQDLLIQKLREEKADKLGKLKELFKSDQELRSIGSSALKAIEDELEDLIHKVKKIRKELKTRDEECCICIQAPRKVVLIPCKHLCLCEGCAETIKAGDACPICRKSIDDKLNVF